MAQPPWHGARGGGRRRGSQWSNGTGLRDPGLGVRANNVWTPAIAAAAASSSQQAARGTGAAVAAGSSGAITSAERPATPVMKKMASNPAPMPPAVKARMSTRQTAEIAEAASKQSVAEIDAHLEQVEKRLSVVIAQEEEVRAIADEHLEREVALKAMLEDLRREDQEEQEAAPPQFAPSPPEASPSAASVETVAPAGGSPGAVKATATPNGRESTDQVSQPDSGAPPQRPAGKAPAPVVAPAPPARREDGQAGNGGRRSSRSGSRGAGAAGAASASVSPASGKGSSLGLLLAMATGGPSESLLTRDAGTIAEYICLMSDEAHAEDRNSASSKRWKQPGLSLSGALNRMEATASYPPRTPNLLALAALIRPPVTIGRGRKPHRSTPGVGKRRREDAEGAATVVAAIAGSGAPKSASVEDDSPGTAATAAVVEAVGEGGGEAERGAKRRCIDPNAIMCPFELNGRCNDDDCRYQHLDAYLPPPSPDSRPADTLASTAVTTAATASAAGGTPVARAETRPVSSVSALGEKGPCKESGAGAAAGVAQEGSLASGGALLPAAGKSAARRLACPRPDQPLPAIEFGRREEPCEVSRSRGQRPKRPRARDEEVSQAGVETACDGDTGGGGGGGGGGDQGKGKALDSEIDDEDGDDFMALPTGSAGLTRASSSGGGIDGLVENERPGPTDTASTATDEAAAAAARAARASPAALAKIFARAASGAVTGGRGGGAGGNGKGAGGGREERYYKDGDETSRPAAAALTEAQLELLEAQLGEGECDVEGWLLLAMHRLPRTGDSAAEVVNTVGAVARGVAGAVGGVGDAALKPALRTFVRALERAARGQGEALWLLYLRLFALLPGKTEDAVGMVEHALEIFPTSRRIWRLYRYMLRRSNHRQSLLDVIKTYRRKIAALLLLRGPAAAVAATNPPPPTPPEGSARAGVGTGADTTESTTKGLGTPDVADDGEDGGDSGGGDHADATVEMIAYLVLECCATLAEAGYTIQAAAEILEALGDGKPLRGWDAAEGQEGRPLLRLPSDQDGTADSGGGGRDLLPEGTAAALQRAPRDLRCLLWLTALHLLVMGVFPQHVLSWATATNTTTPNDDGNNSTDNDNAVNKETGWSRPDLLQWPKEWLSPEGSAGARLSASAELFEVISKTFMSALLDAGLLPPENGTGKGWAPPLKVRGAVFPSAAEAAAARNNGTAPEVSALEGPPLALALNWLTFCSRGRVGAKGVRMVALACCRRFQLARPDHPSMLEHLLLEHGVSKSRSLGVVYHEISSAFDRNGAAAAAVRERGGEALGVAGDGSSGKSHAHSPSSSSSFPTGERLQAVYAFLRVVEMRLQAAHPAETGGNDGAAGGAAASSAAGAEGVEDVDVARDVLQVALVGMFAPTPSTTAVPHRWLQEGGESLRLAVEGARASLFRWADAAHGGAGVSSGGVRPTSGGSEGRCSGRYDALSAERQLSTIVFGLWVLGGPSAATDALDHLLSAESFSTISCELRRLAWLQRLELAVVLSIQQVPEEDVMQGAREVALRALADHRTQRRPEYRTLSHFVASSLDQSLSGSTNSDADLNGDGGGGGGGKAEITSGFPFSATASSSSSSSFARDILTVYATRFREVRAGIDWVVVAEALGSSEESVATVSAAASHPSYSDHATAEATGVLLRWVSWADEPTAVTGPSGRHSKKESTATAEAAAVATATADGASALRRNARPYAEKALAKHPRDTGLACAVAALEAATNRPDRAQRILEAALRASPHCSALWEQRIALEAGFGAGSKERADSTASAAMSAEILLRLFYGDGRGQVGLGPDSRSGLSAAASPPQPHPSSLPARTACLVFSAVTNPFSRRHTKSLSLQGALQTPVKPTVAAATATAESGAGATRGGGRGGGGRGGGGGVDRLPLPLPVEVPRGVFLLTGLVSLSLANNGLTAIPLAIGRLLCLRSLDISGNALTALPPSLSRLSHSLRVLRIARNRLASPLPAAPLGELVSLRAVDLEHNALSEFPEATVLRLTALRSLKLAGNGFPSRAPAGLPDALPHLEELTLP